MRKMTGRIQQFTLSLVYLLNTLFALPTSGYMLQRPRLHMELRMVENSGQHVCRIIKTRCLAIRRDAPTGSYVWTLRALDAGTLAAVMNSSTPLRGMRPSLRL